MIVFCHDGCHHHFLMAINCATYLMTSDEVCCLHEQVTISISISKYMYLNLSIYVHLHVPCICMYVYIYVYIYVYTYISYAQYVIAVIEWTIILNFSYLLEHSENKMCLFCARTKHRFMLMQKKEDTVQFLFELRWHLAHALVLRRVQRGGSGHFAAGFNAHLAAKRLTTLTDVSTVEDIGE